MKKYYLILSIVFSCYLSFGQDATKKKLLEEALENTKDVNLSDSIRFFGYVGLAQEYMQYKDESEYKLFLDSANAISLRNEDKLYEGMYNYTLAMKEYYYGENSIQVVIDILKRAEIAFSQSVIGSKYLPFVYSLSSLSYEKEAKLDSALIQIKKSVAYYDSVGDVRRQSTAYLNLGVIEDKRENYEEAIDWFNKSLKLKEQIGDSAGMVKIWQNSAKIFYYYLDRKEKAIEYIDNSTDVSNAIGDTLSFAIGRIQKYSYQRDSSYDEPEIEEINNHLRLFEKFSYTEFEALTLSILASHYLEMGDIDNAFSYISRSLKLSQNAGHEWHKIHAMTKLAEVFTAQGKNEKAEYLLLNTIDQAKQVKDIQSEFWSYKLLSEIYTTRKNYLKALEYYQKYDSLNDVYFNLEKMKDVEEIQTKYETAEKDKQILLERTEKEATKIENKWLTSTTIGAIALFAIILLLYLKVKKQRNKAREDAVLISNQNSELKAQKREIEQQKNEIQQLKSNYEHQVSNELSKYKELRPPREVFINKEEYDKYESNYRRITAIIQYNEQINEYNNHKFALNNLLQSELNYFKGNSIHEGKPISFNMVFTGDEESVAQYSTNSIGLVRDIVSELFRNAEKYAFSDIESPKISLEIETDLRNSCMNLVYHDNGNGIPENKVLRVISRTVQKLNGEVEYGTDEQGAYVNIQKLNVFKK